jgi:RimJ/RimL family protein N-acetyltransferase
MSIFVRQALAQDWPALRQLFLASRRHAFAWQAIEHFRLADLDEQTVDESIWVAQAPHDELAGFVSLWEPDHFIHHLHVAPTHQRHRVGKMLLQALPQWEVHRYQLKCLLRNEKALAFYAACGFMTVGAGEGEDGSYLLLERKAGAWP